MVDARDATFEALGCCHIGTRLFSGQPALVLSGTTAVLHGCGPRTVPESNAKRADELIQLANLQRATKVMARTLFDLLS